MANTNKRTNEGVKAAGEFIATTMEKIPEIAKDPDLKVAVINHLKETWLPLVRAGVRSKTSPYGFYIKSKGNAKTIRDTAIKEISKFTDLSPKSIEKLGTVIGGIASLVEKGEVEIPSQEVVDREDITAQAGGYANIVDDIYRANLVGQIKNPFGIEGFTARGKVEGSFDQPFENVNVEGSYQVGDASTLSFGVDPINESARLGFKTTWKKGGKVTKKRKKRKTKNYTKGCVVRTAKY